MDRSNTGSTYRFLRNFDAAAAAAGLDLGAERMLRQHARFVVLVQVHCAPRISATIAGK